MSIIIWGIVIFVVLAIICGIIESNVYGEIDYTIVAGSNSQKSMGSSIARGAVGGALLGPVGLIGGAASGKNKTTTTFTIVYKNGKRKVETVDNNSFLFREYSKYLR